MVWPNNIRLYYNIKVVYPDIISDKDWRLNTHVEALFESDVNMSL